MKSNKLMLACVMVAAAGLSAPAFARQGHHHKSPSDYDKNEDCQVTPEEILASRTARFSTIDANGDLSITLDEFKTWMVQKETDRFETLDTDNSNALSKEEFLANRRERKLELFTEVFALADTNVDQSLTYDEFAVFGPQPGNVLFRFAALDTDGDGKISQAEFLAAPWHRKHR